MLLSSYGMMSERLNVVRSLGWDPGYHEEIRRLNVVRSLGMVRDIRDIVCKFAWWRESRKPTWGGSPPPSTAGQGGRLGGGLPYPWPRPPTYKRRGRAAPLAYT